MVQSIFLYFVFSKDPKHLKLKGQQLLYEGKKWGPLMSYQLLEEASIFGVFACNKTNL